MLNAGRYLWMGFICHLVAEKAIKAVISEKTNEVPPKIHDLKSLAKRSGIMTDLSEEQLNLLEQLNPMQIEARYPEHKEKISATLTLEKCEKIYNDTEAFLCWINEKLGK